MTPERWQQVSNVLYQALELAPNERPAFLDRACASDTTLRPEIESLLSASVEMNSSFLKSSSLAMTIKPGTRIDDYEVERLIGSGGMGEVYRARDIRLKRAVAIKVLPQFVSNDPDRLRRFEQEAQAAAALNHPNILAVFQLGTYQGTPFMVLELLEGQNFRERLRAGALPVSKVVEYGVQIARGLAAAHEKGIVHRDLKPENLFLTGDERVKILDFGLAKLTQGQPAADSDTPAPTERTDPGMVMGTAGYIAPEQVRGKKADHRADIFAFGAILYEMLTGRRAFRKATSAETMSTVLNDEPQRISEIAPNLPVALQRVVQRCLEKSPEQRFQSASDLGFALEACSDASEVAPLELKRVEAEAPRKIMRPFWWIGAVAAVVLGAFVAGVWYSAKQLLPPREAGYTQNAHNGNIGGRAELARFDAKSKRIEPYLNGVSADFLSFSNDGKQIAYVSYPDGILWRAKADGSKRVQLTRPPIRPAICHWSPDGTQILFAAKQNSGLSELYTVSAHGGRPRQLIPSVKGTGREDGNWSPDGRKIVFAVFEPRASLAILDAASGKVTAIPGSDELFSPRWSPDGRFIAAMTIPSTTEIKLFDVRKRQWFTLARHQGTWDFPTWSRDGKFLYALRGPEPWSVDRISVPDALQERVVDLTGTHLTGAMGFWFGLDPNDVPLFLRDNGSGDIYALRLDRR